MKPLSVFWHGVVPDSAPAGFSDYTTTVSEFRKHLRFLISRFTPVSVGRFVELVTSRSLVRAYRRPPILLGFDDGFRNVITEALPVLNEFHVPAVFFVLGGILNSSDFLPWFVEVKQLLRRAENKRSVIFRQTRFDLSSPERCWELGNLIEASVGGCQSDAEREELLNELARALGVDRVRGSELDGDLRLVTKTDLQSLAASGLMAVASHGMTHRHLASLTAAEQSAELEQSDLLLRSHCPSYYPAVSYPAGSFNDDTVKIASQTYHAGFAVFVGSSYGNRYAYPRIGLDHCSDTELEYCTSRYRVKYLLPLKRALYAVGLRRAV